MLFSDPVDPNIEVMVLWEWCMLGPLWYLHTTEACDRLIGIIIYSNSIPLDGIFSVHGTGTASQWPSWGCRSSHLKHCCVNNEQVLNTEGRTLHKNNESLPKDHSTSRSVHIFLGHDAKDERLDWAKRNHFWNSVKSSETEKKYDGGFARARWGTSDPRRWLGSDAIATAV